MVTIFSRSLQGYLISILNGVILGDVLPLAIPRAFTDDDSNLGIKSGLTMKQKFNMFCAAILGYLTLNFVEYLGSKIL